MNSSKLKSPVLDHKKLLEDPRTKETFQLLEAKGFFFALKRPRWRKKISVADALWVGENVEPRVLEVLPAALVRFPSCFKGAIPKDLLETIESVSKMNLEGFFRNMPLKKVAFWFEAEISDKRSVPFNERKVVKSFRIKNRHLQKLAQIAASLGKTESQIIESFIETM